MLNYNTISFELFHVIKTEHSDIFFKHLELKSDTMQHNSALALLYSVNYPKLVVSKIKTFNYMLLRKLVLDVYLDIPTFYLNIFTDELILRDNY
jgi:hypothetical protein